MKKTTMKFTANNIMFVLFCIGAVGGGCRIYRDKEFINPVSLVSTLTCIAFVTMFAYIYVERKQGKELHQMGDSPVAVGCFWPVTMWFVLPVAAYVCVKPLFARVKPRGKLDIENAMYDMEIDGIPLKG